VSERRACKLLGVDRASYRYEAVPDRNAKLRKELLKPTRRKPRYGYRRLAVASASDCYESAQSSRD
jgi:putative transposase